jgi:CBS domain-containing protein
MMARENMSSQCQKIDFKSTLSEAAEKMKLSDIGILPVEKDGEIVGMVTDRDIVIKAISQHLNPETTPVNKVMTSSVFCLYDDDEIEESKRKREEKQIHRLLALDNMALEKICEPVGSRW